MATEDAGGEEPRIPPEILHEIVAHNRDDIPTLCNMALASKTLRAATIIHLFAAINLSQSEDFRVWSGMVVRNPKLAAKIVKEVSFDRFFNRDRAGKPRRQRQSLRLRDLRSIPQMPHVRLVTCCTELFIDETPLALSCLALFPNLTELRLRAAFKHFHSLAQVLATSPQLKALYLVETQCYSPRVNRQGPVSRPYCGPTFDLTVLEKLDVQCLNPADFIIDLITLSPPRALKSLIIGNPAAQLPCSTSVVIRLFRLSAPTLESLEVEPSFYERDCKIWAIMKILPSFPVLHSLRIWLAPGIGVKAMLWFLRALHSSPSITSITFRMALFTTAGATQAQIENQIRTFTETIRSLSQSPILAKTDLDRHYPRFEHLGFHFCALPLSYFDYTPAIRKKMEQFVTRETAHLGCPLVMEWFSIDADIKPLSFRENGTPSYGIPFHAQPPYPHSTVDDKAMLGLL
ncbi:hypothetical protein B0H11DRAFT_2082853 [Mycena galericulata]|nr:hypothetical protein B0H11DRAFT_2082853 [Mycena galericulata]